MAKFSPCEAVFDEVMANELTVGPLFQTIRGLGLPPDILKRIEGTVSETARGARRTNHPCLPDLPVRIRVFCSKQILEKMHHSSDPLKGGWGYYVIERSRDLSGSPVQEPCRVVELYLYKEGE